MIHQTEQTTSIPRIGGLEVVIALLKWKKFIIYLVLITTLGSVVVSFLLPKWYKSTVSILPPKEQDLLSSMSIGGTLLKNITGVSRLGGLRQGLGAYNYLAILKSRSAMEDVVHKFDLANVYGISDRSMEKALRELRDNVSFEIQDEDYISIEVYDKSPERAAAMANFFVEVLNNISIQLGTQEARNNREFIEKRLEKSKEDLRNAEEALRSFQEKSGIMIAPDQNMASISAIAELYGMKAKKEVEAAILERTVTKDNSTLQQVKLELSELDKKLSAIPEAGVESFRLYRTIAIQQKIVEYLVPLYEQAKIDEQKDVPVILVLDKAVPSEKKTRPKRLFIIASTFLSSSVLSVLIVLLVVRLRIFRELNGEQYREVISLFRRKNTS
ncbi:MAG: hypothetical protein HY707_04450 [Ignavibacteriae bacterium]|nr:hypothetical protein [Ignavibacteriota bacterium]